MLGRTKAMDDRPFYLPSPASPVEADGFPEGLPTVERGRDIAGPVFLQVGTSLVDPTPVWYDPIEGATTDPYPSVPGIGSDVGGLVCASANVLARANAVASAMVVTFISVSFGLGRR